MSGEEEDDAGQKKAAEHATKRNYVVQEFISTEATYSGRLKIAQDVFLTPMRQQRILEEEEINTQFFVWSSLVDLHNDMYTGMVSDQENGKLNLGARFSLFSHFLVMYGQYLTNYDKALARRAQLLTANHRFGDFVDKAQKDPRCNGLGLESYLIEPVQRVPRYRLLLEQLLKYTPQSHPEHNSIENALSKITEVAMRNNEAIRDRENKQKIMNIMLGFTISSRINLLDDPR